MLSGNSENDENETAGISSLNFFLTEKQHDRACCEVYILRCRANLAA